MKKLIGTLIIALTLVMPSAVLADTTAANSDISKIPYERISGDDSYDTAIAIADRLGSSYEWNNGGQFEGIVLASGTRWEDAIVGAPLAEYKKAPILLVDITPDLPTSQKTLDYIAKHLTTDKKIYILGGSVIIPDTFIDKLVSMGYSAGSIQRIGGYDAPETSLLVAQMYPNDMFEVTFSGLDNFGDALSNASNSAYSGAPSLLVGSNGLTKAQSDFAAKFTKRIAIGNISDSLKSYYSGDENFIFHKGSSIYDTNGIMTQWHTRNPIIYVVQGEKFMDGLAGAVLAARHRGFIILTDPHTVLPETAVALNDIAYQEHNPAWRTTLASQMWGKLVVFGGSGAVSDSVVTNIRQILASDGYNAGSR